MNYEKLIEGPASVGALMQIPSEVIGFMKYIDEELKPKNIMEIGLHNGGTFYLWCYLAQPGGIKLGLDLPNGPWGTVRDRTEKEIQANKILFQTFAPNTYVLWENSRDPKAIEWVKNKLGDNKLDLLFIDADHTYAGVKLDYENYKPFVREGGIIAFHDIKDTETHKEMACTVHLLWEELKGEKKEFVDYSDTIVIGLPAKVWGGIGAVRV